MKNLNKLFESIANYIKPSANDIFRRRNKEGQSEYATKTYQPEFEQIKVAREVQKSREKGTLQLGCTYFSTYYSKSNDLIIQE